MFLPYYIENWIMMIDFHEKGLMSLPLSVLKSLIGIMSTNFAGTLVYKNLNKNKGENVLNKPTLDIKKIMGYYYWFYGILNILI